MAASTPPSDDPARLRRPVLAPNPQRWKQLDAVFQAAVDLDPEQRRAKLDEICADAALRRQVEVLLERDAQAGGFLERPERPVDHDELARNQPTQPTQPTQIGPHHVECEIGRGGMGVVYLAHDAELGRPIAIKCLRHIDDDPSNLERLQREARVLASLSHPNIAVIHGLEIVDNDPPLPALVLEYVDGRDLAERLEDGGLTLPETLRITAQIAAALAAAHQHGLVHRDLKPGNVRITPDGQVKVLDFGLAQPIDGPPGPGEDDLIEEGRLLGTVSYMSPEQAMGRTLDARSDIWAFGCVLFECLSGHRAFDGKTPWQTLAAVVHQAPDWSLLPANLPERLHRVLRRCLRKDPVDRLRDLGDVRLELVDLLGELEGGAPLVPPPRLRPSWATASVVAVLAGCLGLGLGLFSGRALERETSRRDASHRRAAAHIELGHEFLHGSIGSFALAPDGLRLVYRSNAGLVLRELDSFEETLLPDTVGAGGPFFSPDSRWLAFVRNDGLYKVAVDDQVPIRLTDMQIDGIGATWCADGTIVFAPSWSGGLWRVSEDGGEARPLTHLDPSRREVSHRWPHALPDARGILYTVKTSALDSFDDASIALLDLASGVQHIVLDGGTAPAWVPGPAPSEYAGHLLFHRGGALHAAPFDIDSMDFEETPVRILEGIDADPTTGLAALSVARDTSVLYLPPQPRPRHSVGLAWVDPGGTIEAVPIARRYLGRSRLSPDGQRAATWIVAANNRLWIDDLERGTTRPLTHNRGNSTHPIWSGDGEQITFLGEGPSGKELVRRRADGTGEAEVLLRDPTLVQPLAWTTDGRTLIYERRQAKTGYDIWQLSVGKVGVGMAPRPLVQTAFDEREASLSPDGRWLAYISRESATFQLFVRLYRGPHADPGPAIQVSITGADRYLPMWSLDSRRLFFSQGRKILQVDLPVGGDVLPRPRPFLDLGLRTPLGFDGERFLTLEPAPLVAAPKRLRWILGGLFELASPPAESL